MQMHQLKSILHLARESRHTEEQGGDVWVPGIRFSSRLSSDLRQDVTHEVLEGVVVERAVSSAPRYHTCANNRDVVAMIHEFIVHLLHAELENKLLLTEDRSQTNNRITIIANSNRNSTLQFDL